MKKWIILIGITGFLAGTALAVEDLPKPTPAIAVPAEAAEQLPQEVSEEVSFDQIPLPENDTLEYWVIREHALSELVPFLTKKRTEMKNKRQVLADYIASIGRTEDMAAANIVVPDDPKLYLLAFGLLQGVEEKNIKIPEKLERPNWDRLVEFGMRFVIDEGYLPTDIDGQAEVDMYKEMVSKKEQYGQKVHKEMRPLAQQCITMWLYLGQIGEQENLKAHVAKQKIAEKQAYDATRAQLTEEKRARAYSQQQAREDKKFDESLERSRYQRYEERRDYRQDALVFRQSRLDDRYTDRYY